MALDLQGFADLQNDLTAMAMSLENGSGVDRALQAGAEPIEQQMLANASSDPKIITGALHGSIHTSKVKARDGGGKQVTIGVHVKEKSAYYSNPVEYGHGGPGPAPPHPFVRPAFDARAEDAYGEIRRVLEDEISKRP
jgi:HK97 gp10 family phage protein